MPIPSRLECVQDRLVTNRDITYGIIRCVQKMAQVKNYSRYNSCGTEFTSSKFNLNTCLIWPRFNVHLDNVINLVAGNDRIRICSANADKIKRYDEVYCINCDLRVGVMYQGTFALIRYNWSLHDEDYYLDGLLTLPLAPEMRNPLPYLIEKQDDWRRYVRINEDISLTDLMYLQRDICCRDFMSQCRRSTSLMRRRCTLPERKFPHSRDKYFRGQKVYFRYADIIWVRFIQ